MWDGMIKLHLFRSGEAQQVDAGFQNVFGKGNQGNIPCFFAFVLLTQNPGFMIEFVDSAGKLVNIGADQVGR